MNFYPIFLDLRERRVVLVGGGDEAAAKARLLLKTPVLIDVVCTDDDNPLRELIKANRRIRRVAQRFTPELLNGASLAFAADEPDVNRKVAHAAKERNIPVNAVDDIPNCTFLTPAMVERGRVVVAVGTEGAAPILAQDVRRKLEAMLPPSLGALVENAVGLRQRVAETIPRGATRRHFWRRFFNGHPADIHAQEGDSPRFRRAVENEMRDARTPKRTRGELRIVIAPRDPEDLAVRDHRRLMEADVVVSDPDINVDLSEYFRRDAERVVMPTPRRPEKLLLALLESGAKTVYVAAATTHLRRLAAFIAPDDLKRLLSERTTTPALPAIDDAWRIHA